MGGELLPAIGLVAVIALVPVLRNSLWDGINLIRDSFATSAGNPQRPAKPAQQGKSATEPRRGSKACTVSYVVDGDTLVCTDRTRVRLLGVDAPEKGSCHARSSTAALRQLVDGHTLRLSGDDNQPELDTYGRRLVYAHTASSTTSINVALVRQGAARARTSRPALTLAEDLAAAQTTAERNGQGLWAYC